MDFARMGQFSGIAGWVVISGLISVLVLIVILLIIIILQLRRSNSLLEKISVSMVDIFEILFSNKEFNSKILKAFSRLNTLTESQPPALNSISNTLSQLQSSIDLQTEALKKINANIVTMYKNLSLSNPPPLEKGES